MIRLSGPLLEKYNSNSPIAQAINSVTKRLSQKDSTIWGDAAQAEASVRLNWIDLPRASQDLIEKLDELKLWSKSKNFKKILLCGMGGSSLAPEVFGKVFNREITILDSTHPDQIASALNSSLSQTLIIIGSKSGSTIETNSHKNFFESELEKVGLDPKDHLVIVTDPGSPLESDAVKNEYKLIVSDPNVGGRFSALSAFGLVPASLMNLDINQILRDAEKCAEDFTKRDSAPVVISTLLLEQSDQFLAFCDNGSNVPGISDWIEQLIAESTGKDGKGRLPIVLESFGSDISGDIPVVSFEEGKGDIAVEGSLSEQFIFWEWVTALVGYGLGVDPFNQPNVAEAKERTAKLLKNWSEGRPRSAPTFLDEDLEVYSEDSVSSLDEALLKFLAPNHGYVAIMAYLNREQEFEILKLRNLVADKFKIPTTFGWGPRFLHSTGQFHKGGQQNGAFIQITSESSVDFLIPNTDYSFQTLISAQAIGDGEALKSRNLPLIRIHLKRAEQGVRKLLDSFKKI